VNVLVIGGGGREHALSWRLSLDSSVQKVFCAPGNPGMSDVCTVVSGISQDDRQAILEFTESNDIGLVVVGPEQPLVDGLVDFLTSNGVTTFGPNAAAAKLEGSKSFAKEVMIDASVPTAGYAEFNQLDPALAHLERVEYPCVVKADGLAAGKGVTVAVDMATAKAAVRECLADDRFGLAGHKVVIEEFLDGYELSILALVDGTKAVPLAPAQDYKPVFNGQKGPNTGGMGCYSPVPSVSSDMLDDIVKTVFEPTLAELKSRGIEFRGVLYAGLMIGEAGHKVLEFNTRFGDPETQVVMPRLQGDLAGILTQCANGTLDPSLISWSDECCVDVVLASGGYPSSYQTGLPISGLDVVKDDAETLLFHAGTGVTDGKVTTNGGRVLNVCGRASDFSEARKRAYAAVDRISFEGMHFRTDIASNPAGA